MADQHAGLGGEFTGQPFGDVHGAVLAAGAADGDCQVIAVVADVAGQPGVDEAGDVVAHAADFRLGFEEGDHWRIPAGQWAQLGIVVRVAAKSASINIGTGFSAAGALVPQGTSAGFGKDSDSASSTTLAAISGIAGNKEARTGDKETGIGKIFDQEKVQKEIEAQTKITQTFGQLAPKAAADFAKAQADGLKKQGNFDEAKKWEEGGAYRIALHTALGGLAGGTSGALGAAAGAAAAPLLNELQDGIAKELKAAGAGDRVAQAAGQLISGLTAAGIGAAVGGTQGAMTAFNTDANNRQLHPDQVKRIQKLSADPKKQEQLTAVLCVLQNCDIDGLRGYDAKGQAVFDAGKQLSVSDPELFKQLANEVRGAGLLSGEFVYLPGGGDFTKDAFGKYIDDKLQGLKDVYDLAKRKPDDLGSLAKGAVKGLANNVKDGPQYPLDGADEKQGAILANTALVVGPAAVAAGAGTLNAMGRAWEAGKVLNAGEIGMSSGGNISAQQITRVGTPAGLTSAEMNTLSNLDSMSSGAAGAARETVSNSYFERNGFKALDGKCGAGNCFDGVYIRGDQVIVNEVKPLNADGSIKLSPAQPSGLPTQGTIEWVLDRATYLKESSDPVLKRTGQSILDAHRNGNLTTLISGVNSNGMVIVKVKP